MPICQECGKQEAKWQEGSGRYLTMLCDDCKAEQDVIEITIVSSLYWGDKPETARNWAAYVEVGSGPHSVQALLFAGNWVPGNHFAMLVPTELTVEAFEKFFKGLTSPFTYQFPRSADEIMIRQNGVVGCPGANELLVLSHEGLGLLQEYVGY